MPKKSNPDAAFWRQMRDAERSILSYALECGGSITKAAELLGISVPYMSERTHELGIIAPAPAKRGRPLGSLGSIAGSGGADPPEEPEEGTPTPKSEAKPPKALKAPKAPRAPRVLVDGRPSTECGQPSCSPAFVVVQGGDGSEGGDHEDGEGDLDLGDLEDDEDDEDDEDGEEGDEEDAEGKGKDGGDVA